jgi:hypothetical protein
LTYLFLLYNKLSYVFCILRYNLNYFFFIRITIWLTFFFYLYHDDIYFSFNIKRCFLYTSMMLLFDGVLARRGILFAVGHVHHSVKEHHKRTWIERGIIYGPRYGQKVAAAISRMTTRAGVHIIMMTGHKKDHVHITWGSAVIIIIHVAKCNKHREIDNKMQLGPISYYMYNFAVIVHHDEIRNASSTCKKMT